MIIDTLTQFCVNYDLDQETGSYLATNQVDLGAAPTLHDIGNGEPLYLVCVVTETFTDGGDSATLTIQLRSDDSASIHATTSTLHLASDAKLKAALVAGTVFCYPIPVEARYERYLGVQFVVATAGFDTGMMTAFLSKDPHGWRAYPDAL